MRPTDRARVLGYYAAIGEREWERLERPGDGAVEMAVTMAALERYLAPSSAVLDIGAGPGRYAVELARRGHHVTLADLSPKMLDIARAKVTAAGVRVVEIAEADACDLSRWDTATYDAALSLGPFYHLVDGADRIQAVRELARVVRPGGLIFAAAMPRLAFLQRTIALPDERHHLLDEEWMRRLLKDGVFENEIPGRFSLGYGVEPGEMEQLLDSHGITPLETLSAESLSAGVDREVGDIIANGGAIADVLLQLMVSFAGDHRLLGAARHLLVIGRRR